MAREYTNIADAISAVNTEVSAQTTQIADILEALEGKSSGGHTVDDKFRAEFNDTVSKVNALTADGKAYVILCATDTHAGEGTTGLKVFTEATIPNWLALCDKIQVDAVMHLGDLINGNESKAVSVKRIKDLRNLMMSCGKKWYIHDGNHDHNGFQGSETSETATAEFIDTAEMTTLVGKHADTYSQYIDKMWFYEDVDVGDESFRIVYLSSNYRDNVGGGYGTAWGYPTTEINWVNVVALDTDNPVLFFSHMGLVGADSQYGTQPNNGTQLKSFIDTFADGGTVMGYINGHNHWDRIKEYDNYNAVSINGNGVWNKSTTSDIPATVTDAKRWDRSMSDYTMDCFDVIVIRPTDKTIDFIRFGAGEDRQIAYSTGYIPIRFTNTLEDVTAKDGTVVDISMRTNKSPTSVKWEAYVGQWVDMGSDGLDIHIPISAAYNGAKLRCTISDGTTTVTTREATLTVTPSTSYTNVLDTVGYEDGKYMSGATGTGSDANYTATGYIAFTPSDVLYIKGNPGWAEESHCRMTAFNSSKGSVQQLHGNGTIKQYFTLETLGTNYVKLTPKTSGSYILNSETAFVRMSVKGKGADTIITVNEVIE